MSLILCVFVMLEYQIVVLDTKYAIMPKRMQKNTVVNLGHSYQEDVMTNPRFKVHINIYISVATFKSLTSTSTTKIIHFDRLKPELEKHWNLSATFVPLCLCLYVYAVTAPMSCHPKFQLFPFSYLDILWPQKLRPEPYFFPTVSLNSVSSFQTLLHFIKVTGVQILYL